MKEHGSDTQLQIIDAAMHHFAEYGYRGTSISKIAEEAGVSKSLIFWYFENKATLFQSLVDRFVRYCIASLDSKAPIGDDPRVKLESLIDTYWDFIHKNFKYVQIFINWLMQIDSSKKENSQKLEDLHNKFRMLVEDHLVAGVNSKIFRADLDTKATSLYILSCLEGFLLQIFIHNMSIHSLDEELFSSLKKNLMEGLVCHDSK